MISELLHWQKRPQALACCQNEAASLDHIPLIEIAGIGVEASQVDEDFQQQGALMEMVVDSFGVLMKK